MLKTPFRGLHFDELELRLIRQINLDRIATWSSFQFVLIVGWKGGEGPGRQKGKGREIVSKSRPRPQTTSKTISPY